MSFLENLVGRNLGTLSTIRPRPVSMFEPVKPSVTSLRTHMETPAAGEAEIEAEAGTTPRGSSPNEHGPGPQPRRRKARTLSVSAGELDVSGSAVPPVSQDERRPASQRRAQPKSSANAEDLGTHRTRRELSSPDTDASDSDRHELRREPDAPLPGPRDTRERGGLLNSGRTSAAPPATVSPVEQHEFHTQSAQDSLSPPKGGGEPLANPGLAVGRLVGPVLPRENDILGDHARGMRSGDQRDSALSRQARSERQPVIEVTIGRIEIRAETNGASTRRTERPASPVMGLDEYLRRKSNRGNA